VEPVGTSTESRAPTWTRTLFRWAAVLFAGAVLWVIATTVDWSMVAQAFANLQWWMVAVLVVLTIARQFLAAAPLTVFVPAVGYWRAAKNDTGAAVVATVAPPPADVALRLSMFRAWGVDLLAATSGVTLATLLFYVVRLCAPAIGICLLLLSTRTDASTVVLALASTALAAALVIVIVVVGRSERGTELIGRSTGKVAAKVQPARVDPDVWAAAAQRFRGEVNSQLVSGWRRGAVFLTGMMVVEAALVAAAVRFTGVPADVLSVFTVAGALLVAYPLTMLPMMGLGVMDAAIYAILVRDAGEAWGPAIVAALVVWRAATTLVPLVMGVVVLLTFRSSRGAREADDRPAP
jgi:putative heme transporter